MPAFTLLECSLLTLIFAVHGTKDMVVSPSTVKTSTTCGKNDDILQTCFVCEHLPFDLGLPLEDCCTDNTAFEICKTCIADPTKCLLDYLALVNGDDPYENDNSDQTNDDVNDVVDKRFGRLFLGQKPVSYPTVYEIPVTEKRVHGYGEPHGASGNVYKRWGTLNMGSRYEGSFNLGTLWKHHNSPYVGKRDVAQNGQHVQNVRATYESSDPGNPYPKRYGTLNLGKRYGSSDLRKRYGTLHLSKRDHVPNEDKRYGMLYLGKKWGSLGLKKKWGTLGLRKTWGTLGLENTHHHVPTKGDTASSGMFNHMDKRYGRLFL